VHPHIAHQYRGNPARAAEATSRQLDATPSARAVGEIGLDYHYDFSPRDVQQAVFRAQLAVARERRLPVVIHTREADDDTLSLIAEQNGEVSGVLHCFTGGPELAARALELGFYISVAGILTFPRASALRDTVKAVPLERLLIETDSPFLAPVPHRGRRNEPAHVASVAAALAELHRLPPAEIGRVTSANFDALFRP
jgi:TatD DNase family protein